MTQSEFLIDAVLAMNRSGDIEPNKRVTTALTQLDELIEAGIEFDEGEEVEQTKTLLSGDHTVTQH